MMEWTKRKGEVWSFLRRVLDQGTAIQQDYQSGTFKCYEEFSAHMDEAARKRTDELEQLLGNEPTEPQEAGR
jgi:hypothetical protein